MYVKLLDAIVYCIFPICDSVRVFNVILLYLLYICFFFLTDPEDSSQVTEETRSLGLVVCRGPAIVLICPGETLESIPNPFLQAD